jgi:acyl-CoA oxidase
MISTDDTFVRVLVAGIAIMVVLIVIKRSKSKKMDEATIKLLTTCDPVPPEVAPCMEILSNAPVTTDESECAEQLRKLVLSMTLPYSSLATNPELLLNCSKHVSDKQEMHGALWTRFTVQFNLFAGSIVALGGDAQREVLYATQSRGNLGCFAFTECGAGVLSGACVETTAVYNTKTKKFSIHSPTESSKKKWISQGMYAEYAVILANLMIEDSANPTEQKNVGPHLFFARIQVRYLLDHVIS